MNATSTQDFSRKWELQDTNEEELSPSESPESAWNYRNEATAENHAVANTSFKRRYEPSERMGRSGASFAAAYPTDESASVSAMTSSRFHSHSLEGGHSPFQRSQGKVTRSNLPHTENNTFPNNGTKGTDDLNTLLSNFPGLSNRIDRGYAARDSRSSRCTTSYNSVSSYSSEEKWHDKQEDVETEEQGSSLKVPVAEYESLINENSRLKVLNHSNEAVVTHVQNEVTKLKDQLLDSHRTIQELQRRNVESDPVVKGKEPNAPALIELERRQLKEAIQLKDTEIAELSESLNLLKLGAQASIFGLDRELGVSQTELTRLKRISEMRDANYTKLYEETASTQKNLLQEVQRLSVDKQKEANEVENLRDELEKTQEELTAAKQSITEVNERAKELSKSKQQVSRLQNANAELEKQIGDLRRSLSDAGFMQSATDQTISSLNVIPVAHMEQLVQLERQRHAKLASKWEGEIMKLKESLKLKSEESSALDKKIAELREENEALKTAAFLPRQAVQGMEEAEHKIVRNCDDTDKSSVVSLKSNDLEGELDKAMLSSEYLKATLSLLQRQNAEVMWKLDSKNEECNTLQEINYQLLERFRQLFYKLSNSLRMLTEPEFDLWPENFEIESSMILRMGNLVTWKKNEVEGKDEDNEMGIAIKKEVPTIDFSQALLHFDTQIGNLTEFIIKVANENCLHHQLSQSAPNCEGAEPATCLDCVDHVQEIKRLEHQLADKNKLIQHFTSIAPVSQPNFDNTDMNQIQKEEIIKDKFLTDDRKKGCSAAIHGDANKDEYQLQLTSLEATGSNKKMETGESSTTCIDASGLQAATPHCEKKVDAGPAESPLLESELHTNKLKYALCGNCGQNLSEKLETVEQITKSMKNTGMQTMQQYFPSWTQVATGAITAEAGTISREMRVTNFKADKAVQCSPKLQSSCVSTEDGKVVSTQTTGTLITTEIPETSLSNSQNSLRKLVASEGYSTRQAVRASRKYSRQWTKCRISEDTSSSGSVLDTVEVDALVELSNYKQRKQKIMFRRTMEPREHHSVVNLEELTRKTLNKLKKIEPRAGKLRPKRTNEAVGFKRRFEDHSGYQAPWQICNNYRAFIDSIKHKSSAGSEKNKSSPFSKSKYEDMDGACLHPSGLQSGQNASDKVESLVDLLKEKKWNWEIVEPPARRSWKA